MVIPLLRAMLYLEDLVSEIRELEEKAMVVSSYILWISLKES